MGFLFTALKSFMNNFRLFQQVAKCVNTLVTLGNVKEANNRNHKSVSESYYERRCTIFDLKSECKHFFEIYSYLRQSVYKMYLPLRERLNIR